jgi:hypothetical protein
MPVVRHGDGARPAPARDALFAERHRPGRRADYALSALSPLKMLFDEIDRRPKSGHVTVHKGDTVVDTWIGEAAQ